MPSSSTNNFLLSSSGTSDVPQIKQEPLVKQTPVVPVSSSVPVTKITSHPTLTVASDAKLLAPKLEPVVSSAKEPKFNKIV